MRISFFSWLIDLDLRIGPDDRCEPAERGPGVISADLSVSQSDAAEEWTTYEDRTPPLGFTS